METQKMILQPVLLSTEDASEIFLNNLKVEQLKLTRHKDLKDLGLGYRNQHLCLCSDRDIKEGDWILCSVSIAPIKALKGENYLGNKEWKKIDFTSDPKLIADGVTAIPEKALINDFVKANQLLTQEVHFLSH